MIDTRSVDQPNEPDRIAVYVQLDNGVLRVLAPRKRVDSETTRVFIGWMFGLSLLLLALAVYFMTRQVRPILRLARAMDKFGKGRDVGDFRLAGPTEIRRAGAAFNLMRKRILRHLGQRTEMLAAVSHDLRTPLTRMKLELAMLAEGEGRRATWTICAPTSRRWRGWSTATSTSPAAKARRASSRSSSGRSCRRSPSVQRTPRQAHRGRARAADHPAAAADRDAPVLHQSGAERGCATAPSSASRAASTTIRSGSPSTTTDRASPESERDAVFKPFYRLDAVARPSTGGVGLGLTIARDIVLGHGGEIELTDAPEGGLRVLIRLPS